MPTASEKPGRVFERTFSTPKEAVFQAEMATAHSRRMKIVGAVGLLLYGLFAVTDPLILPGAYRQAWEIRALTLPLIAFGILGGIRLPQARAREMSVSAAILAAGISLAWIGSLSRHPNAMDYHAGIILLVLAGNIALSLRFRYALVITAVMSAIYAFCLIRLPSLGPAARLNNWLFFFATGVISLLGNFQMNRDRRIAHAARFREQERNEELSHAVELLEKLSTEDALTQIANRRELDQRLKIEWARARREAQPLAMIVADVDCFKDYNDHYGHPAGDGCLQQIATALRAVPQRASDLVARFGGEEFVVLLPGTTLDDAAQMAERMRQGVLELNMPHAASQVAPVVSASFGVAAALPTVQDDPAQLLADADAALYRAKQNGRNQVAVQVPLEQRVRRA